MSKLQLLACFSLLIILIPAGPVWGEPAVTPGFTFEIPETVLVSGPKITLADLGRIKEGNNDIVDRLKQVALGNAPQPGEARIFNKAYLQFIFKQYQLDSLVNLEMDEQAIVRVNATCIQRNEIEKAIQDLCETKNTNLLKKWVELRNLPKEIWLGRGDWKVTAYPVGALPEVGTALFKVTLSNGTAQKILNVSGKIRTTAMVYQANRNISLQTEVKSSDFELVERELVTGKEVVGEFPLQTRTTKLLKKGEILRSDQIQPIPLVFKDHDVKVTVKDENVVIKIMGVAKVDGWLGDDILILNPTSHKIFRGKVTGDGNVEVKL